MNLAVRIRRMVAEREPRDGLGGLTATEDAELHEIAGCCGSGWPETPTADEIAAEDV